MVYTLPKRLGETKLKSSHENQAVLMPAKHGCHPVVTSRDFYFTTGLSPDSQYDDASHDIYDNVGS